MGPYKGNVVISSVVLGLIVARKRCGMAKCWGPTIWMVAEGR